MVLYLWRTGRENGCWRACAAEALESSKLWIALFGFANVISLTALPANGEEQIWALSFTTTRKHFLYFQLHKLASYYNNHLATVHIEILNFQMYNIAVMGPHYWYKVNSSAVMIGNRFYYVAINFLSLTCCACTINTCTCTRIYLN